MKNRRGRPGALETVAYRSTPNPVSAAVSGTIARDASPVPIVLDIGRLTFFKTLEGEHAMGYLA